MSKFKFRKLYAYSALMTLTINAFGGQNDSIVQNHVKTVVVEQTKKLPSVRLSQLFDDYNYVPLETNEESMIGRIDQIIIYQDTIYILDRHVAKSLFIFKRNGEYIGKIKAIGKGPGEYLDLGGFDIDKNKNSVVLLSSYPKKILYYTTGGEFINENRFNINSRPANIAILGDKLFFDVMPNEKSDEPYVLYCTNLKGETIGKYISNIEYRKGFSRLATNGFSFFRNGDTLLYHKPFMNSIFSITESNISEKYRFESKNVYSKSMIDEINGQTSVEFITTRAHSKMLHGFNYCFETSTMSFILCSGNLPPQYYIRTNMQSNFVVTPMLIDDVANLKYIDFIGTYDKYYIGSLSEKNLVDLKQKMEEGLLKPKGIEKYDLNIANNPILIFYKCREEINIE